MSLFIQSEGGSLTRGADGQRETANTLNFKSNLWNRYENAGD